MPEGEVNLVRLGAQDKDGNHEELEALEIQKRRGERVAHYQLYRTK